MAKMRMDPLTRKPLGARRHEYRPAIDLRTGPLLGCLRCGALFKEDAFKLVVRRGAIGRCGTCGQKYRPLVFGLPPWVSESAPWRTPELKTALGENPLGCIQLESPS